MPAPTVSAVLTFYRHDRFFPDALASVLGQSRRPDEILVVDDSSPAGESATLTGLPDGVRVIRTERNVGIGAVRKLATETVGGDYVAYLDCDDMWTPEKLARQVAFLEAHPDASCAHTGTIRFHQDGSEHVFLEKPALNDAAVATLGSQMLPSCFMARRRAVLDAGNWSPDRLLAEDWDLEIRITDRVGPMRFLAEPLMRFRRFDHGNLSGKAYENTMRLVRTVWAHRATVDKHHRAGMWRSVMRREMTGHAGRIGGLRGAGFRLAGEALGLGTERLPA